MSKQRQTYAKWHISTKHDPKRKQFAINKCHIIDFYYLKALVQSQLPLKILNLAKNKIKSDDFQAILNSQWPLLQQLQLSFNSIGNQGAKVLSTIKMQNLTSLELNNSNLTGMGMKYLVQTNIPLLVHLSLGCNKIGVQGCKHLSQSLWPSLRRANLYGSRIQNEGLQYILRANWKKLQQILLDDNNLAQQGLERCCLSIWSDITYLGTIQSYQTIRNPQYYFEKSVHPHDQVPTTKASLIDFLIEKIFKYTDFCSVNVKNYQPVESFDKLYHMSKVFYEKWDQVYRVVKQKLGLAVNEETFFGPIESFAKKKVGPYHVIRNISYAQKKGSTMLNKAREQTNIKLPFTLDKFHFTLMPYFEIVAFVDLDNRKLTIPTHSESEERIEEHGYETEHIIKISKSHIAHGHSIYVPYLREHLPQILTPKLLQATIKLSGILPGQKIGYNSQGGGSTVNHFHAQLIDGSSLLDHNQFHFQTMEGAPITTLIADLAGHKGTAKIHVSSFEYVSALYIRIACKQHKISQGSVLPSIVKAVWSIIDIALTNSIPHNLNIPNQHEVYIILRNFAENDMRYGWVEFSGVQIITNDQDYDHITAEEIAKRYARLGLPEEILEGKFKNGAKK